MIRYLPIFCLAACGIKPPVSSIPTMEVTGTFSTYHSALGAGNGIIIRVPLQLGSGNELRPDSFFLRARPQSFTIVRSGAGAFLETNIYVTEDVPTEGGMKSKQTDPLKKESLDSLIVGHRFDPSWIIASGTAGRMRINISSFKETTPNTKY